MNFKQWLYSEGLTRLPFNEYLYKPRHIITLIIVFSITILLALLFRKKSKKAQEIVLKVLFYILILFEIIEKTMNMIKLQDYTFWNIYKRIIPCHFSSIIVVVLIIAHFTKKQGLKNAITIGGLLGSIAFLAHPAVGLNTDRMGLTQLYSVATHALAFTIPVLYITYNMVEFKVKKIYQPFLFIGISSLYALILNTIIFPGSNYMYFMENELSFDMNIHLYRLSIIVIVSLFITLFYVKDIYKIINRKLKNRPMQ